MKNEAQIGRCVRVRVVRFAPVKFLTLFPHFAHSMCIVALSVSVFHYKPRKNFGMIEMVFFLKIENFYWSFVPSLMG